VDIIGAALGCIALIYFLKFSDGPDTVMIISLFAAVAGLLFNWGKSTKRLIKLTYVYLFFLFGFIILNTYLFNRNESLLPLVWVKGTLESKPIFEKWNSYSRIKVSGDSTVPDEPFGWGLSTTYPRERKVLQTMLNIDASAGTCLTGFKGDLSQIEHLKYDVTNMVHYIRKNSDLMVIGMGGGRDVLSGLAFGQKKIYAVEMNDDIINTVKNRFGDFSGHLDKYPNVTLINDEARSYISRTDKNYDIIQISLIDTWAATAAGAFVLSENNLYTKEAWKIFFNHLNKNGILSCSRWYDLKNPTEIYRVISLASTSLFEYGIKNPKNNIIVISSKQFVDKPNIGTILICKSAFSDAEIDSISKVAHKMQFEMVFSPKFSNDNTFDSITSMSNNSKYVKDYPLNISPPTDDKPFFFQMLRFDNIFNFNLLSLNPMISRSMFVLGALLLIVTVLTVLCIIIPLKLKGNIDLKGSLPNFIYFASIGFGFMFVEISQMQRLTIFLGHPVYGLSVMLFTLLLSSGIGSIITSNVSLQNKKPLLILSSLIIVLLLFGNITPYITNFYNDSDTTTRIIASVGILFPLGLLMGTAFPIGMKIASARKNVITPWLWGINGATSVFASVLAVAISIAFGITLCFWFGVIFYIFAGAALIKNHPY
jgi:hypothetical protein